MIEKHIISLLFLLSVPIIGSAHAPDPLSRAIEDSMPDIKLSEVSDALGKAVCYVTNEIIRFKKETVENISPETKAAFKSLKEKVRKELKYARDAVRTGYVQGLRGENFTPPNKY